MKNARWIIPLLLLGILSIVLTGCPRSVDERIRESTRVPGLSEGVQARDRALETAVEQNIMSDFELQWYARTYGLTVEVSHTVATVHMIVKNEEYRDRAIELATNTDGISEVVDNIEIDPNVDEPPFEI
jgi:osmotically-inducible protein OsmY